MFRASSFYLREGAKCAETGVPCTDRAPHHKGIRISNILLRALCASAKKIV
jgi:hypothetical protein